MTSPHFVQDFLSVSAEESALSPGQTGTVRLRLAALDGHPK